MTQLNLGSDRIEGITRELSLLLELDDPFMVEYKHWPELYHLYNLLKGLENG